MILIKDKGAMDLRSVRDVGGAGGGEGDDVKTTYVYKNSF